MQWILRFWCDNLCSPVSPIPSFTPMNTTGRCAVREKNQYFLRIPVHVINVCILSWCCSKNKAKAHVHLLSFHFFSRQLHGLRIALHKNLFISLLFNAVFEIWFKTGVLLTLYDGRDSANETVLKQVNVQDVTFQLLKFRTCSFLILIIIFGVLKTC